MTTKTNRPTNSLMVALMMTAMVVSPLAEAKRVGGGKSYGMSRSSNSSSYNNSGSSTSYSTPQRQSVTPVTPAPTAPQRSGVGMGTVAGAALAAGAVGYMVGNSNEARAAESTAQNPESDPTTNAVQAQPEEQKRSFAWLWLIVLAAGAFFLYRRFSAKKSVPAGNSPFVGLPSGAQGGPFGHQRVSNPNTNLGGGSGTNIFGQSVGGAGAAMPTHAAPFQGGDTLPDGTSKAAFLRQARASFLHLQSMNANSHVEELRRYFTPEMYEHIRAEVMSNQDTAEFPQLNAQVVESATEGHQYVASVLYSGLVSESLDAPSVTFSETWHFVKPIQGGEWLVAGIQQN